MGVRTSIQWTRSSRNAWSGCTKVSLSETGGGGCDGCYAEAFQRWIRGINVVTKQAKNWGPGAPRVPHLEGFMKDLRKWNRKADIEKRSGVVTDPKSIEWDKPGFWPVFINSHSDTFDNEVPARWRELVFKAAEDFRHLTFQLVTKRIGQVEKMVPRRWLDEGWPDNVWLIATMVNRKEVERDMPKLLELRGVRVKGLSMEPLLSDIDLRPYLVEAASNNQEIWGIVGGESDQGGHKARPCHVEHIDAIVSQLREFGYAAFVKQLGSNPWAGGERLTLNDDHGGDKAEWSEQLRVQEFPRL